jgi:hypothetical protein
MRSILRAAETVVVERSIPACFKSQINDDAGWTVLARPVSEMTGMGTKCRSARAKT